MSGSRLLTPQSTFAIILGAHDWTEAKLNRAPSFLHSGKGILGYLIDSAGFGLDPELVLDLFDDADSPDRQLRRIKNTLSFAISDREKDGNPITDVLVCYIGHGQTDDQGRLALLLRCSAYGMEAESGIKAVDLARILKVSAPKQRRVVILDCCFSESAASAFIGMSSLDQAVAAVAASDLKDETATKGTLLLCSSPLGEVSWAPKDRKYTAFSGALLHVLRNGIDNIKSDLSLADLRDAAYNQMLIDFGSNAKRPVLHQLNAKHGDLTRIGAFPNVAERARRNTQRQNRLAVKRAQREEEGRQQSQLEAAAQRKVEEAVRLAIEQERKNAEELSRIAELNARRKADDAVRAAVEEHRRSAEELLRKVKGEAQRQVDEAVQAAVERERKAAEELSWKAAVQSRREQEKAVRSAVEREREVAEELRQKAEGEAQRRLELAVQLAVEMERKTAQAVDDAMAIFAEEQQREKAGNKVASP